MVKLSKRMLHLADMVPQGAVLADVGTDHGYIPIYLVQSGKVRHAFAMDIREGPLQRAKEHIRAFGLEDYITVRLSDGVAALSAGEADTVLIAGMGGGVMLHILEAGKAVIAAAKELILQPQSEVERVREYLYEAGYIIDREDMVYEDGKYYPMMHIMVQKTETDIERDAGKACDMACVLEGSLRADSCIHEERQIFFRYGACLLREKNEVLQQYLAEQIRQFEIILENLSSKPQTESLLVREGEISKKLACAKRAAAYLHEV